MCNRCWKRADVPRALSHRPTLPWLRAKPKFSRGMKRIQFDACWKAADCFFILSSAAPIAASPDEIKYIRNHLVQTLRRSGRAGRTFQSFPGILYTNPAVYQLSLSGYFLANAIQYRGCRVYFGRLPERCLLDPRRFPIWIEKHGGRCETSSTLRANILRFM